MHANDLPAPAAHGALRLDDWGVICASGPDAAAFLNGQLTQDMLHLDGTQARLAGYCSPKGRLLASFITWRAADDEIALACSADLLPATLKRLSMFVLRAKCKLVDASERLALYGLAGPQADALVGSTAMTEWSMVARGDVRIVRLPTVDGVSRYLWIGADAPMLPALEASAWRWLEVRSGLPRIVAATVDQFVPQMLNYELLGGVNFKKGCYPGQEVVARSQYRGTLKRRTYLLDGAAALQPGQEVFHSADPGQPAGMVVLAASADAERHAALVELKIAALDGGTLHAGAADGPLLRPAALPYALEPLAA